MTYAFIETMLSIHKKIRIVASSLLLVGLSLLHISVNGAESSSDAMAIEVYGNHYLTDESVIQMSGLESSSRLTNSEAEKKLLTTNLFSSVNIKRTQNGAVVVIVREKSTAYILPYFSKDAFSSVFGLVFAKSSLLGQNSTLLTRYQFGKDDHQGTFLLKDEFFLNTPVFLGFSLDFENSLHREFQGREVLERWSNRYQGGSFQVGYHVNPWVFARLNTYIERHTFEESPQHYKSGFQLSHRLFAECGKYFVSEGLTKGYQVVPSLEFNSPWSDFNFYKLGVTAQISMLLKGDFNWNTQPSFKLGRMLPRYQRFETGGPSLRGFPSQQFRSDSVYADQNDFLITSFDFWKLKMRPLLFTDFAYVGDGMRSALGAGFFMYFHEVSIPAIQVFAGYGFNPSGFSVSAAIGPQF